MLTALSIAVVLAIIAGAGLGVCARRLPHGRDSLNTQIDRLLPQTQCGKCGYDGCRPYADAIARGGTDINRCPPGGTATIRSLAALLNREVVPLDPEVGSEAAPAVAVIDESVCIGCTICIQECPVDAIVGARKLMHTVISNECTGCELCVAPCPVDCIDMVPTPLHWNPQFEGTSQAGAGAT